MSFLLLEFSVHLKVTRETFGTKNPMDHCLLGTHRSTVGFWPPSCRGSFGPYITSRLRMRIFRSYLQAQASTTQSPTHHAALVITPPLPNIDKPHPPAQPLYLHRHAMMLLPISLLAAAVVLGATVVVVPGAAGADSTAASVNLISSLNDAVTVHCWSRETDIGAAVVYPGQNYYWEFHPNIFGHTMFKCNLMWRQEEQEFAAWKGSAHPDRLPCCAKGPCNFKICPDGIYNELLVDTDDYEPAESWCYYLGWNPNPVAAEDQHGL